MAFAWHQTLAVRTEVPVVQSGAIASSRVGLIEATPVQVREALAERANRLQEQQQLPVFNTATLEGSPADYQTRLRSPTTERKAPGSAL